MPFGTVDEISRHCLREEEPETVHIEVHLPRRPDPERLRHAFAQALRRHPRALVRERPGARFRRRYEWELADGPDTDPVSFPPPGPDALALARARALGTCPPLSASPPMRLEAVVPDGGGCVLVLTLHHTALDGPAALRILATAAQEYVGAGNAPAPPRNRAAGIRTADAPPRPVPRGRPAPPVRPVRLAADRPAGTPAAGDGMLVTGLPLPPRPPRGQDGAAPYTVNDQLLVATALTVARWNRLHGGRLGPVLVTMPADDRPRGADMPIGNGTRLLEVRMSPGYRGDERLLAADRPDPDAVARLLRLTAGRTRALKAAPPGPPLGRGAALLTAPVLPVGVRGALARGLRAVAAPWTSTVLLSNIGRVPYPLDFGDAGRARAVWFSGPARMPRGLSLSTAAVGDRLHLAMRWRRALLDDDAGALLGRFFAQSLAAATTAPGAAA
ncbi:condensation protein [Streptomyces verrucosisporus]|nr:condensation protein [Streptomyces verrucosisporus]